jgi:DNA modification methylase
MIKPYYEENGITIYHGDCRDILPIIKADVMIADPPYGLGFNYDGYSDTRENLKKLISSSIAPIIPCLKRTCILPGITQVFLYPEPQWIASIQWNTTGSFGKYGYSQWMPILLYGDDLNGFGSVNGVTKTDCLNISGGGGVGFMRGNEKKDHPCPKPENVMRKVLTRFTLPNEIIVDPCGGSGTTAKAAKETGRRCILIEQSEKYCEIAVKRLAQGVLDFAS